MSVKKEIEQACADLEKFSSVGLEHTLWEAHERIENLENALMHIKKTAKANKSGKLVVDIYSDSDDRDLKKFIKWALKEQHW